MNNRPKEDESAPKNSDALATAIAIQPDDKDPRLLEFQGRKKLFNGGQNPLTFLSDLRQEKWIRTRKAKVSSRPN